MADAVRGCNGRLSELGSGLFRKQIDLKGLGFDSSVFRQTYRLRIMENTALF